MTKIHRQVRIDGAPMDVATALAASPWRGAMSIDPDGAGSRVSITATVEPEPLAMALEETILAEVCAVQQRFSGTGRPQRPPQHPNRPQPKHQ